ncbi:hypothetical protein A4G99_16565 [Haladaptatus sp. R4]|uniref:HalOD1 output domain-containing protein n=1 Tax=Haladaptatus sp. R4 TaxID=1679489 RepID=UPI0007B47E09|nr:HalOD1 output domain-containing protein [Haladaptatus sp. R4]KZN23110.1 hypothetical protein A4G99_16565 [Haladaptatus sp. R4]
MTGRIPPSDDENEQSDTIVYQTKFDPTTDNVSEAVIRVVRKLNDADLGEFALLWDVVDPDALDSIFAPKACGVPRNTNGYILIKYDAYYVRVKDDGQITVYQSDPEIDD